MWRSWQPFSTCLPINCASRHRNIHTVLGDRGIHRTRLRLPRRSSAGCGPGGKRHHGSMNGAELATFTQELNGGASIGKYSCVAVAQPCKGHGRAAPAEDNRPGHEHVHCRYGRDERLADRDRSLGDHALQPLLRRFPGRKLRRQQPHRLLPPGPLAEAAAVSRGRVHLRFQ